MSIKRFSTILCFLIGTSAGVAQATTAKDVDLMFVIDRSGSMGNEFTTLADNLEFVFNSLTADAAINSVGAGLITYEGSAGEADANLLVQNITTNVGALKSAVQSVSVGGGTERGLSAVDSAIPGGESYLGVNYRPNTVRSIVLITDEDADDENTYAGSYAGLGNYVKNAGYLNNIITLTSLYSQWEDAAVPTSGLFDLSLFTSDPTTFFTGFVNAKIAEVIDTPVVPGVSPVPLPAPLALMASALLGLGFMRRRAA